jgi:hypothetical protein
MTLSGEEAEKLNQSKLGFKRPKNENISVELSWNELTDEIGDENNFLFDLSWSQIKVANYEYVYYEGETVAKL